MEIKAANGRRSNPTPTAGPHSCPPLSRDLLNFEKLDVENQRRIGRNHPTRTTRSVGQVRRDEEFDLATFLHELDTLGPARDDAIEGEGNGLVALVGAVELLTIDGGATVVDKDGVGGLGALSVTFGDDLVLEAAGGGVDAGLGGVLFEVGLTEFEIGGLCHKMGWVGDESCRYG